MNLNTESNSTFPLQSAYALSTASPQAAYTLFEGLLHEGEVMMISGGPKSGKSRFALQLALCLAGENAEDFLGHAVRTIAPVLYIDNGSRDDALAERLRDMAEAQGETLSLLDENLTVSSQMGNPRAIDDLAEMIPWIQQADVRLVVIDSLAQALALPETATQAQRIAALRKAYATLARYASVTGAAFVCLHDANEKGLAEAERLVDTHVRLQQHLDAEDALVMSIASRSFAEQKPVVLRKTYPGFTLDDEGLDPRLVEGLSSAHANALRQEAIDRDVSPEAVVNALRSLGGKSFKHALRETVQAQTGCSWRVAADLLAAALREGLFSTTNVTTKSGRHAILCALPEVDEAEVETIDVVPVERIAAEA